LCVSLKKDYLEVAANTSTTTPDDDDNESRLVRLPVEVDDVDEVVVDAVVDDAVLGATV